MIFAAMDSNSPHPYLCVGSQPQRVETSRGVCFQPAEGDHVADLVGAEIPGLTPGTCIEVVIVQACELQRPATS